MRELGSMKGSQFEISQSSWKLLGASIASASLFGVLNAHAVCEASEDSVDSESSAQCSHDGFKSSIEASSKHKQSQRALFPLGNAEAFHHLKTQTPSGQGSSESRISIPPDWSPTYAPHVVNDFIVTSDSTLSRQLSQGAPDLNLRSAKTDSFLGSFNNPTLITTNIRTASDNTPTSTANPLPLNTPPTTPPRSTAHGPPWADEISHARQGLAKRLANLEPVPTKAIPWPIISKKGQQVSVRFKLAPNADFSHFMVDAIARLGSDPQGGAPSSGPLVRVQAYDR